ncbi:MAG: ABC transporter ATP-binding protein [Alphaproteobacteria bacterium]
MLSLSGITKAYGPIRANESIDLEVEGGQIHALLGENGAGKSTLMKILFGLVQPDAGKISFNGTAVKIKTPQDAKELGIGMVQQHFALFDGMTALENIRLGLTVPPENLRERIAELGNLYGLEVDPDALVLSLSAGQKQRIEIVRALLGDPMLLVLDEPTSVLTPQEADLLFNALRKLRDEGRGLIFISHKLGEVRALCDSATVLRAGKVVGTCDPRETDTDVLAEMMIGQRLSAQEKAPKSFSNAKVVLSAQNIETRDGLRLDDLELHEGEILGVAGIAGNGQDRLFALLSGEAARGTQIAGELKLRDEDLSIIPTRNRRAKGARFVPEERLGHSAIPDFKLSDNTLLTKHSAENKDNTVLRRNRWIRKQAAQIIDYFDVRGGDANARARSFSGGNLQKFVVGRELDSGLDLLIISQPTWGVDLWAASRIRQEIQLRADQGTAVLLISQDLDELMALTDSLSVIANGVLTAVRPTVEWSVPELGRAMAGELEGMVQ